MTIPTTKIVNQPGRLHVLAADLPPSANPTPTVVLVEVTLLAPMVATAILNAVPTNILSAELPGPPSLPVSMSTTPRHRYAVPGPELYTYSPAINEYEDSHPFSTLS